MKIGKNIEGSLEEINGFFENRGLRLEDYLEKPETPLKIVWLIVPAALSFVTIISLVLLAPMSAKRLTILFIIGGGFSCWLTASVQIRFKSWLATTVVAIGLLLFLLIAGGFISPKESVDLIKTLKAK